MRKDSLRLNSFHVHVIAELIRDLFEHTFRQWRLTFHNELLMFDELNDVSLCSHAWAIPQDALIGIQNLHLLKLPLAHAYNDQTARQIRNWHYVVLDSSEVRKLALSKYKQYVVTLRLLSGFHAVDHFLQEWLQISRSGRLDIIWCMFVNFKHTWGSFDFWIMRVVIQWEAVHSRWWTSGNAAETVSRD